MTYTTFFVIITLQTNKGDLKMKIVRNRCNGGFSLSNVAVDFLGLNNPYADIERTDLSLVNLVEADANKASGNYARLEVVEIPLDNASLLVNAVLNLKSNSSASLVACILAFDIYTKSFSSVLFAKALSE